MQPSKDTHHIFLFGEPASGKTNFIGSMISHISERIDGDTKIIDSGDINSQKARELLGNLTQKMVVNRQPYDLSTVTGTLLNINLEFSPKNTHKKAINFTFLEMSGEDLITININQGGELPFKIDEYIMYGDVKTIFVITAPADVRLAAKNDNLINQFLDHIKAFEHHKDTPIIWLVTKWDEFKNNRGNIDVDKFLKDNYKLTYSKIRSFNNHAYYDYSIGNVHRGQIITNSTAPKIFNYLYEKISGEQLEDTVLPPPPPLPRKYFRYALFAVLVLFAGYGAWYYWREIIKPPPPSITTYPENLKGKHIGQMGGFSRQLEIHDVDAKQNTFSYSILGQGDKFKNSNGELIIQGNDTLINFKKENSGFGIGKVKSDDKVYRLFDGGNNWYFEIKKIK